MNEVELRRLATSLMGRLAWLRTRGAPDRLLVRIEGAVTPTGRLVFCRVDPETAQELEPMFSFHSDMIDSIEPAARGP